MKLFHVVQNNREVCYVKSSSVLLKLYNVLFCHMCLLIGDMLRSVTLRYVMSNYVDLNVNCHCYG